MNACQVLIGKRLYPVVTISSAHLIVEIGAEKTVTIGDLATLIGPDDPGIESLVVARQVKLSQYQLITAFSARLPRRLV